MTNETPRANFNIQSQGHEGDIHDMEVNFDENSPSVGKELHDFYKNAIQKGVQNVNNQLEEMRADTGFLGFGKDEPDIYNQVLVQAVGELQKIEQKADGDFKKVQDGLEDFLANNKLKSMVDKAQENPSEWQQLADTKNLPAHENYTSNPTINEEAMAAAANRRAQEIGNERRAAQSTERGGKTN